MSFSFLRIASLYTAYLNYFYHLNYEKLQNLTYEEHQNNIFQDFFSLSNSYEYHFQKLGVKTANIIFNDQVLQKKWATENNCSVTKNWQKEIVYQQIKSLKPEVVLFQDCLFSPHQIASLKLDFPFIKLIIGFCCSPYMSRLNELAAYDFVITCTPCFVKEFKKHNIKSYLIYHAFEPRILDNISIPTYEKRKNDFIFLGQLNPYKQFHQERINILNNLIKNKIKPDLYVILPKTTYKEFLRKLIYYSIALPIKNKNIKNMLSTIPQIKYIIEKNTTPKATISAQIIKTAKPPIYGLEMYKKLANSKIGFNAHIDITGCCAGNVRIFETTGLGTCLITDYKQNMKDIFEDGKEVVLYKNSNEAVEKIKWLFNNPTKMAAIAKAGQKKVLTSHTYQIRAKQLYDLVIKNLA